MPLLNKTIKIKNIDVLFFFYPSMVKRNKITMLDRDLDVIYIGEYDKNLLPTLIKGTKSFINTVGPHNIDLTEYEGWVKFVSELLGKSMPNPSIYKGLPETEFFNWLKLSYITRKWQKGVEESNLFNLFKSFYDDIPSNIKKLLELFQTSPEMQVESGFLTFLGRVNSIEEQAVSPAYLKLLIDFEKQFTMPHIHSIVKETYSKELNSSLRLLDFILNLRYK